LLNCWNSYDAVHKFPPLTEAQQAEISALQAMPDESIDYKDIPPLTEEFWQNATRHFLLALT
jgi:hypothetical protein